MALTQISTGMLASGDGTVDLNIDNGTFVVDVSTSRVGIGTSSPVRPLSVKASQEQLTLSEGDARGATFDYSSATGNLNIATNGINARTNPQFTLDLNGRVGIGTSSPWETVSIPFNSKLSFGSSAYPLSISRSSSGTLITTIEDGYDSSNTRIDFKMRAGSANEVIPLSLASSGNVGIGTSSIDGTLHVHTASAGTVTASTQADDIVIENNAEGGMTIITPDDQSARIRFTSPSTTADVGGASIFYRQNINKMSIGTEVAGGILALKSGAGSDGLLLDASGNVVVGGTSLNAASSVGFTAAGQIRQVFASGVANDSLFGAISGVSNGFQIIQDASNNQSYIFHNGGTPSVTINSSGNVGIGTASPSTTLTVVGSGDAETGATITHSRSGVGYSLLLNNTNNGANKGSGIKWQGGGFDTAAIIGRSDATAASGDAPGYLTFHTSADGSEGLNERMRIASAGGIEIPNRNSINELTFTGTEFTNVLSSSTSGFQLGTTGGGYLSFLVGNTERLQITLGGDIFAAQQYTGGFGGMTTGGTASFDHSSNARAGNAYTLLQGTATGGPGGTAYYHVFNYEYVSKNSTGNLTQLAYGYNDAKAYIRFRYSGTWGSWVALH